MRKLSTERVRDVPKVTELGGTGTRFTPKQFGHVIHHGLLGHTICCPYYRHLLLSSPSEVLATTVPLPMFSLPEEFFPAGTFPHYPLSLNAVCVGTLPCTPSTVKCLFSIILSFCSLFISF